MLDCTITIGDKTYTTQEFVEFIMQNGMGALSPESPTPLAEQIVHKYDLPSLEDSVVEIWTNLEREKKGLEPKEYLTEDEVNEQLNPSGNLSDYGTQKIIRYNTYSGIALTGISANFGKVMGYVFDAEAVRTITNGEEVVDVASNRFEELGGEKGKVELFLRNNPTWKIHSRNAPVFKSQYHFTVDNTVIDSYSRQELKLFARQRPTNIFETIDTIINLAIDNVKEGKLHLLGITNANSNAYLAMVGMGLPLAATSRIFKTPVMKDLNEGGRWQSEKINSDFLNDIADSLFETNITELDTALQQFTGDARLSSKILRSIEGSAGNREVILEALKKLPIKLDVLDRVYTGKETGLIKTLSDAAVLSTMKKMIPIGEEMFTHAQAYSLLRGMPSKKWKIDSIISKIEELVSFEGEQQEKNKIADKFLLDAKDYFRANDEAYKAMAAQDLEQAEAYLKAELSSIMDNKIFQGSPKAAARASFVNRLLRKTVDITAVKPKDSVFVDNIITRLPHVMAGYRAAVQLRTLIEKAFRMYSPPVRRLAERIITKANIFSPFDKLEKTDTVQKEIVKYLSSNLIFKLDGEDFSTEVPPTTETYSTSYTTVSGAEAWSQRLIKKIAALDGKDNEFINSLEIPKDETTGLLSMKIVANKTSDEEVVEAIRRDFLRFKAEYPELARDMFKYAILTEGMYYERTGLALVFPDLWAAEYSQALQNRIDSIIPLSSPTTEYNLALIEDSFIHQFVRNNPSFIGYPRTGKAKEQGSVKTPKGRSIKIYHGQEEGISFDLKYPDTESDKMPQFIRFFSDDIFMKLDTPHVSRTTYYVKLVEGAYHSFYDFNPYELEKSLDLDKLSKNYNRLINTNNIVNGNYTGKESDLQVGQVLWAIDKSSPAVLKAITYQVQKEGVPVTIRGENLTRYSLNRIGEVDLTKELAAVAERKQTSRFLPERLGNTIPIDDIQKYVELAAKQPFSRVLTNNTFQGDGVIKLDIPPLTSESSSVELDTALKYMLEQVNNLERDLTYFVDSGILNPLNDQPALKRKVARQLQATIGFYDNSIKQEAPKLVDSVAVRVEQAIKDDLLVTSFVIKPQLVTLLQDNSSTHSIPLEAFLKKTRKSIRPQTIIKLDESTYGYVNEVENGNVLVSQFPLSLFLLMENGEMAPQTFENLVKENLSC